MSESDILSIQLWLGAAAIAFLAIGMTVAGWNHKLFIRSMFVLASLLAMAAVFWPRIRLRIPEKLDERLGSIANNQITWFIMFTAAPYAIFLFNSVKKGPHIMK